MAMAKAKPKAWFTSPMAKINYRSVDSWAERMSKFRPYFNTWGEAHEWMLVKAKRSLKRAKAELASAERHLKKVEAMEPPTT